jgi:hypothetical protein
MEGNKMSTEEVDGGHKEGPPWKTVGRFPTFDEADQRRLELAIEKDLQVKVGWRRNGAPGRSGGPREGELFFVVKARLDPALAEIEVLNAKREEKKRRKAKLNKKRRKK